MQKKRVGGWSPKTERRILAEMDEIADLCVEYVRSVAIGAVATVLTGNPGWGYNACSCACIIQRFCNSPEDGEEGF